MAKKVTIESVITRSWEVFKKNWVSFVVAILLISIIEGGIVLVGMIPLIFAFISMAAGGMSGSEIMTSMLANWESLAFSMGFAIVFFIAMMFVSFALRGGLVEMTVEAFRKRKTSYSTAFSSARKRWKTFMGIGLIINVIVTAVLALFMGPGLMMMLAGDTATGAIALILGVFAFLPVAFVFGVIFSFVYVTAIVNKLSVIKAIKASMNFARKNFWATLGILLIFAVISFLASLLDAVTYVLGSAIISFIIVPVQMLSLTALYLGRKKGRR